ncbi:MFS transporter [Marinoscillum furvescens]|uniref:ACS family glucarate transporter-like MFS transporter n=1 Tax=Marinoscillum furvescens DSM 4134 TaxID=1122208 RepID=A0A3D9L5K1_MARFU|nr:MFS transporter [Marinoscillum furvescens]REE01189.1 ACS family glucarate transporter-like MFS transporter [Marinoscillum furvescens DSM 4134]
MMPSRYFMVLGTFLLALLLYIDRVCISVAKDAIGSDLALSDTAMGWVLSAFALGYATFQTPGGIMSDRLGPRRVLTAIVSFWSVCTALTGAAYSLVTLLIVRFLFGAGEAGAFPGIARAVYSWIPMKERGIVNGINFSGSRLGAAFALPLVAWMIAGLGWRVSFFILGGIGIVWALAWYLLFRDRPEDHPAISPAEKKRILDGRQEKEPVVKQTIAMSRLFGAKNMWLAMGQYFASNFTFFFALTWLYPHLKSTYSLDSVEAGMFAAVPLIGGAVGNWFSGVLVDRMYQKGNWALSRSVPAIVGFVLAAGGLLASLYADGVYEAVIYLTVAILGADMTLPPSWSFCVDIGKENAGAVSGTMNMAGNVGSFLTALAFPYLFAWTGSIEPFFYACVVFNLLAIFLWIAAKPEEAI